MNAAEALDVLEAALADAYRRRLRRRDTALTLVSPHPEVLGARGKRLADTDDGRSVYGFTLAQAQQMSDLLREAIREDAGLPPLDNRRRR